MIRIGIAGLGLMGQMHAANYLKNPNAEVVALADADEDRRNGRLTSLKSNLDDYQGDEPLHMGAVRPYANVMDLCADDGIDAVAICLPSDLHADPAVAALEAGKHVFCEKPLALNPEQGRRMIDAAAASGKTLMVGHCLRFWPEYVEAEKIIRSGEYGSVVAASFARCSPRPAWSTAENNWFSDPNRSGGVAIDLHIHDADIAVWWWGKPGHIHATGAFNGPMPSVIHSHWEYENGPSVQFEGSWENVSTSPFYFDFKVTMEKGSLVFGSRSGDGLQLATEEGVRTIPCDTENAYRVQDDYFIDCLTTGKLTNRCLPEDSLTTLECVAESSRQLLEKK